MKMSSCGENLWCPIASLGVNISTWLLLMVHNLDIENDIWRVACEFAFHNDDVMKWKHFLRSWPFVSGIHRSPVNSPHKGQWRGALMLSFIHAWTNGWAKHRDSGELRRHCAHYDATVMTFTFYIDELHMATCYKLTPWGIFKRI